MDRSNAICGTDVAECPRCTGRFLFYRSRSALIDSCGFESYRLNCRECGVALAGIVDPCDEKLLLSELAGEIQNGGASIGHDKAFGRTVRERLVG